MTKCAYQHIGDDGVIVCDKYSNFAKGIITFCDQKIGCTGKKLTNADRLRAMNDEELARWLSFPGTKRELFPNLDVCLFPGLEDWLPWLQQEVTDV